MTTSELLWQDPSIYLKETPIVEVKVEIEGVWRTVHLKLESYNPAGSIKDRTAAYLLHDLEQRKLIQPDSIIIESTSGNLGVALAYYCALQGCQFHAVIDPKVTPENRRRMEELGAQIDCVQEPDEPGGYLLSRMARINYLIAKSSRYVWTNQYDNPANPQAHYCSTAPEIFRQMGGEVDVLFVAVSTGGTLAGVAGYFRQCSPHTKIVAVDAMGSVIFGGVPGSRKLTGIGSARKSSFIREGLYDEYVIVKDQEAFSVCRCLAKCGLKLGGSSGAVISACLRYLSKHRSIGRPLCICADDGSHYNSTIFNNAWMSKNGFTRDSSLPQKIQIVPPKL